MHVRELERPDCVADQDLVLWSERESRNAHRSARVRLDLEKPLPERPPLPLLRLRSLLLLLTVLVTFIKATAAYPAPTALQARPKTAMAPTTAARGQGIVTAGALPHRA